MEGDTTSAILPIGRALRTIGAHSAIDGITVGSVDPKTGAISVDIDVRLGLPNAWMAEGGSPSGVRAVEPVTLTFPAAFPLKPPRIQLRADFDRSLAHVNPGPRHERPIPCISEASLSELLQHQGLAGILNQLVLWLENAALGRLIDPQQGWEPVRRDGLEDFIVADAAYFRSFVSKQEGYKVFKFDYLRYPIGDSKTAIHGEIGEGPMTLNATSVSKLFGERASQTAPGAYYGRSVAIFVWPGKRASGEPFVSDKYRPETVTNLGELVERATDYGCNTPLGHVLAWLEQCLVGCTSAATFPIAIILCARRPCHMIGSNSPLELCPYLIEIAAPRLFPEGDQSQVRPAGHRHAIAAPLLRSMSGNESSEETPRWIQVGAGSLGSKLALHLARAGRAPYSVIDHAHLSPHNAARHALVPNSGTMQISWMGSKAEALTEAIKGLGQTAEAHGADIVAVSHDPDRAKRLLPERYWAIVNSTASLAVREALASTPTSVSIPRVIETTLFADGRVGLLSVEGSKRNPNTGDLITECYSIMNGNEILRSMVFTGSDSLQRQATGEGCGSVTMVMTDSRVSMLAAPMAENLATLQRSGLPANSGRILLGVVGEDGMSQSWRSHEVAPWLDVAVGGAPSWHVRISDQAHRKIVNEVSRWPAVETGGILVGRFSEAAQTFYIVDVLAAPEDSSRSAAEFVLGVAGVRAALESYSKSSADSLYCLGTWHSHLRESGPSPQDRATATTIGLARLMPSVLLIRTPTWYRAVLAEAPAPTALAVEPLES